MYSPEVFFSSKPATADEMEFTKQVFLTGKWRLNELYDRMGIPADKKEKAEVLSIIPVN
jgi:hypothetical protein